MLRVWGRTNSVNVQKVLWCLGELGLSYERIDAGLQFGGNGEPWFLAMNPNGTVPLLDDDGFTLWESNSIVRYLGARHAHGTLYPASAKARADAERWMDWQISRLARPAAIAFWNLVRTPAAERDHEAVARAVAETNAALDILDRHLAGHRFVAGHALTIGDIPAGALTHRWLALESVERPEWPGLRRWYAELTRRAPYRDHVMLPLS